MNLRQFFTLLRQQRLFSGIYITCTALSVALAMTLFLVVYIKFGPIYPEQDRARMAVVSYVAASNSLSEQTLSSGASIQLADTLRQMPEVENLTCIADADHYASVNNVRATEGNVVPCKAWIVDDEYWKVFNFRFLHGRGLGKTECESFAPVCVVSETLARKVFGRSDVVGCDLKFNTWRTDSIKRIVGVVEDVSPATPMTYGHLWIGPTQAITRGYYGGLPLIGSFTLVMRLRPGHTLTMLQERVAEFQKRINLEHSLPNWEVSMADQPDAYWAAPFREADQLDAKPFMRQILYMLLAFLLLPAINMGSMVAGRMGGRINELGIRRAYGATRKRLVWQVLQENFLLTLIGGLAGLLLSWLIMNVCSDWLPFVFNSSDMELDDTVFLHADMLFSGWVMLAVLAVCMILNLVSALVPTLWFLYKPVTEALNHKQN